MAEFIWETHAKDSETLLGELQYKDICSARLREDTMAPFHNLTLFHGNDKTYHFVTKDAKLDYVDVSGSTAVMTIARDSESAPFIVLSTENPEQGRVGSGCYGDLYFFVKPADTMELELRQYFFEVKVTLKNGKIYTIAQGIINLR